jgi:hypothetical protein
MKEGVRRPGNRRSDGGVAQPGQSRVFIKQKEVKKPRKSGVFAFPVTPVAPTKLCPRVSNGCQTHPSPSAGRETRTPRPSGQNVPRQVHARSSGRLSERMPRKASLPDCRLQLKDQAAAVPRQRVANAEGDPRRRREPAFSGDPGPGRKDAGQVREALPLSPLFQQVDVTHLAKGRLRLPELVALHELAKPTPLPFEDGAGGRPAPPRRSSGPRRPGPAAGRRCGSPPRVRRSRTGRTRSPRRAGSPGPRVSGPGALAAKARPTG